MSKKPPAFPLYASDFYMDTVDWDNDEIGIYFRLLMCEWVNGPLENSNVRLAKIAKLSVKKFDKKWKKMSQKFVTDGQGNLINLRLESVRAEKDKYLESVREAGKRGAEKRWGGHSDPNSNPNDENMPLQSSSSNTPPTPPKSIGKPNSKITPEQAVEVYEYYRDKIQPEGMSRARALKNIQHHGRQYGAAELKATIDVYHSVAHKRESTYRKDPANFFGQKEPAFLDYLPGKHQPSEPKLIHCMGCMKQWKPEHLEDGKCPACGTHLDGGTP